MRLIDADAFIDRVDRASGKTEHPLVAEWFRSMRRMIEREPSTLDYAPVVRCKECKYYKRECEGFTDRGFCSEGRRRP